MAAAAVGGRGSQSVRKGVKGGGGICLLKLPPHTERPEPAVPPRRMTCLTQEKRFQVTDWRRRRHKLLGAGRRVWRDRVD